MHLRTKTGVVMVCSVLLGGTTLAQRPAGGSAGGGSASSPASTSVGRDTSPLNAENSLEIIKPANGADEKAYKAFQKYAAMPDTDIPKKTQAGEDFLKKFGASPYAVNVYQLLTVEYIRSGQVDKGVSDGEKAIQLNPNDARTMGILSQTLSRTTNSATPDPDARLAKAKTYADNAIAGIAKMPKPNSMSDADFAKNKNDVLAMAHGTLGLIKIHKNDYEGAIPDLEQAVQLGDTQRDPTDLYLLGVANQNSGHYDKAAEAYEKCAAVKGNLQAICTENGEQAKKQAAAEAKKP